MRVGGADGNYVRTVARAVDAAKSLLVNRGAVGILSDDLFPGTTIACTGNGDDVSERCGFHCFANRIEVERFFRGGAQAYVYDANVVAVAILNDPIQAGDHIANAAGARVVQDSDVNQVRSRS